MKKFENHNFLTIFAGILIVIDCFVEIYFQGLLNEILAINFDFNFYRVVLIAFIFFVSLLGASAIFLKQTFALKICLVAYLIQILGLIINDVYYVLSFGLSISWSIPIVELSLEINLVAVLISLVIYFALASVTDKKL